MTTATKLDAAAIKAAHEASLQERERGRLDLESDLRKSNADLTAKCHALGEEIAQLNRERQSDSELIVLRERAEAAEARRDEWYQTAMNHSNACRERDAKLSSLAKVVAGKDERIAELEEKLSVDVARVLELEDHLHAIGEAIMPKDATYLFRDLSAKALRISDGLEKMTSSERIAWARYHDETAKLNHELSTALAQLAAEKGRADSFERLAEDRLSRWGQFDDAVRAAIAANHGDNDTATTLQFVEWVSKKAVPITKTPAHVAEAGPVEGERFDDGGPLYAGMTLKALIDHTGRGRREVLCHSNERVNAVATHLRDTLADHAALRNRISLALLNPGKCEVKS